MLETARPIRRRLTAAGRVHQQELGRRFALGSLKCFCVLILASVASDVIFHLSAASRMGLMLALGLGAVATAGWAFYVAQVRSFRLDHVARLLEDRDRSLGSRLINFLQLESLARDARLRAETRELAGLAVSDYAETLGGEAFERWARSPERRRQGRQALASVAGLVAILAAGFPITWVELPRFLDPFGDHPPYSFTRLEVITPGPAGTNVWYGQGVTLEVKASGHRPREVFVTAFPPEDPAAAFSLPLFDKGRLGYHQRLENIRSDLLVYAHTKDRATVSKKISIGVILTPQLEQAYVRIEPPPYTGLEAVEQPFAFKGVQALAGSQVRFRLRSNRPLREGWLEFTTADAPPDRLRLVPTAEHEVAAHFLAARSGRLRFALVDTDGIPSVAEWESAFTVTHDLPPDVQIVEPPEDSFVAIDFKLPAQIVADDDYGLRTLRIHRALNGVYSPPREVPYPDFLRHGRETLEFNLGTLGIAPGDIISFFAEAIDTAPAPQLARSRVIHLKVISVEEYNRFLLEQTDLADLEAKYAALVDDLAALIAQQKELGTAAEAARQRPDPAAGELDALVARQNELNRKLEQLADRMDTFVRDEPLYDVELEFRQFLREQAGHIRASTLENDRATLDIAQRSSPPQAPRQAGPGLFEEFRQASDAQVARLGGAEEETREQVTQTLEDLSRLQELLKDFNQFQQLYQVQATLAEQARSYDRAGPLDRTDQLALKSLAATEKNVGDLLHQLERDLRDHAQAAAELFPKAAQSGRDLADAMARLRLEPLARQGTTAMLAGQGDRSYRLAERLRSEMEKLLEDCQGGPGSASEALDQYLTLQRGLRAARNFSQMSLSRKPGSPGQGSGFGIGAGAAGISGTAGQTGPTQGILGNERLAARDRSRESQARSNAPLGQPDGSGGEDNATSTDALEGVRAVNRESVAVLSESLLEEYGDVVDGYFRALTERKEP